jgi:hypothetical protein
LTNEPVGKLLGLRGIGTAAAGFDNVPGIIIYKPEDIT